MDAHSPVWTLALDASNLPQGQCRTELLGGRRIAIVHAMDGWSALDDACPHRGGPLGSGFLDGGILRCPLHGWGFNVASGACLERPERPVRVFPVEIRDGGIWVLV